MKVVKIGKLLVKFMAIIYGKSIGYIDANIIPPKPEESEYSWYKTVTTAQDVIIDTPGWYKLYVIGNGGNGGRGANSCGEASNSSCYSKRGGDGGGGGLGGYAIHEIYLPKDTVVSITADSTKWQVEVGEDIIYATHGGVGRDGYNEYFNRSSNGGEGGTAGTAGGGNVANENGSAGVAGTANNGGGGPGGQRIPALKYAGSGAISGNGTGGVTGASTTLGAAASGTHGSTDTSCDQGSDIYGGSWVETSCRSDIQYTYTRYAGYTGGVVIEAVAS